MFLDLYCRGCICLFSQLIRSLDDFCSSGFSLSVVLRAFFNLHCWSTGSIVDLNEISEVLNKYFCLISSHKKHILLSRLFMCDFTKDGLVWSGDVFGILDSLAVTSSVIFCLKWSRATSSYLSLIYFSIFKRESHVCHF